MNKIILTIALSLTALVGFSQESSNAGWELGYDDNSTSSSFETDNSLSTNSGSGVTGNDPDVLATGPGTSTSPIDQYTTILLVLGGLMIAGIAVTNKNNLQDA